MLNNNQSYSEPYAYSFKGAFNNYVDKMGGGGQKMSVFVHAQGIKTVHSGGRVKKYQNSVHVVVECLLGKFHLTCDNSKVPK